MAERTHESLIKKHFGDHLIGHLSRDGTAIEARERPQKNDKEDDEPKLLTQTIQAGLKLKVIKPASLKRIVVDTTVQEKSITFPTDAKLYNKARQQLIKVAKEQNITLRQTYDKACHELMPKIGRYGHVWERNKVSYRPSVYPYLSVAKMKR